MRGDGGIGEGRRKRCAVRRTRSCKTVYRIPRFRVQSFASFTPRYCLDTIPLMNRTKIVMTIGPASNSRAVLDAMLREGVDVVRFNMSHGTFEDHRSGLTLLRELAGNSGTHIAAMADLCGPKLRIGRIDAEHALLHPGDECRIASDETADRATRFHVNYPDFVSDVQVGQRVLIDDGNIRLLVVDRSNAELICTTIVGGRLSDHKGVNVPDSALNVPALTQKDRVDAAFAVENGFDFVAMSFIRSPDDVRALRSLLVELGSEMPIIAKIETPQAISRLDEIIGASNGLLVARGDLGVEMDVSEIPMLQKDMVARCRRAGKPTIIATQMLHSMVERPTPTRAEVSDVANAVLDGADAIMLSAESAVGRFPVEAVATMHRICMQVQDHPTALDNRQAEVLTHDLHVGHEIDRTASAVARSAALIAHDLSASLLAVWCRSGRTARWLSKYQGRRPIVALCTDAGMCRRMSLSYGVLPLLTPAPWAEGKTPWHEIEKSLMREFELKREEVIVVIGDPLAMSKRSTISIYITG